MKNNKKNEKLTNNLNGSNIENGNKNLNEETLKNDYNRDSNTSPQSSSPNAKCVSSTTKCSYKISTIKQVLIAGLLLATSIVFSRFLAIKTPVLKISFAFIPNMLCGIILGPWWGMCVAGLTDLIGALLFPFGAYFVGYTITATLSGFIYGLFLQKKHNKTNKKFIFNLIISILLVLIICNSILNTLWLHITAKKAFFVLLPTRLLKQLIMLPIEIITMFSINLGLEKLGIFKMIYEPIEDYEDDQEEQFENNENISDQSNIKQDSKSNVDKTTTKQTNKNTNKNNIKP